jgi:hypothetical protein
VIALVRQRRTFAGYAELAEEAQQLRAGIRGAIFRDGSDLVISGEYQKLPVVVRFSNSENTPGLNIRMQAQSTLAFTLASPGTQLLDGGRAVIPTGDSLFDIRFVTRTNQPTQARLFMTRGVVGLLQKLCCSSQTCLAVSHGMLEVSELIVPHDTSRHVLEHLNVMARLAADLRAMPGADQVKIIPFPRERHLAARIAIAAAVVVTIASVLAATRAGIRPVAAQVQSQIQLPAGLAPLDAELIPDVSNWRLAQADDFDRVGVAWMIGNGVAPRGRVEADFSGRGDAGDVAYALADSAGNGRVVLLAEHQRIFDSRFPSVGLMVRVPRRAVSAIEWVGGKGPEDVRGDGLLVATGRGDQLSIVVLFVSESRLLSFVPANYQQIRLQ